MITLKKARRYLDNISNSLVDILYPPVCFACGRVSRGRKENSYICPSCAKKLSYVNEPFCYKCGKPLSNDDAELCYDCSKKNRNFERGVSLFEYDDIMKKSIVSFKEHGKSEYAEYYAQELFKRYEKYYKRWDIEAIIPVPVSKKKLIKRGYNQAELIATHLSKLLHVRVEKNIVEKIDSEQQKKLNIDEREKNSKRSFILGKNIVKLSSVLIVDDVFTTGSTVDYISYLLKNAGCKKVYYTAVCIGSEKDD